MKYLKLFENIEEGNSDLENAKKYPHIFNLFIDHRFLDENDYEEVNKLLEDETEIKIPIYDGYDLYDLDDGVEDIIEECSYDQWQELMLKAIKYKPEHFTPIRLSASTLKECLSVSQEFLKTNILNEKLYLYSLGFLKLEDIYEDMPYSDKALVNGNLYFKVKELSEFEGLFWERVGNYNHKEIFNKYVGGEGDTIEFYDGLNLDLSSLSYHISDYTDETMKKIITKLSEVDGLEDDEEFINFCEENDIDIITWQTQINQSNLEEVLELDIFEEVKDNLIHALEDARANADLSEAYNACLKPLYDLFDVEKFEFVDEHYLIPFNKSWFKPFCVENNAANLENISYLSEFVEYLLAYPEEMDQELLDDEYELLEVDIPYYGWDGTIDKQYLNDMTIDRLND